MKKFYFLLLAMVWSHGVYAMTTEIKEVKEVDGVGDDPDVIAERLKKMKLQEETKDAKQADGGSATVVGHRLKSQKSSRGRRKGHNRNQSSAGSASTVNLDDRRLRRVRNNAMVEGMDEPEYCPFVSARKLYLMMENYNLGMAQKRKNVEYHNEDMQRDAKRYLTTQLTRYVKEPAASIKHIAAALSSTAQYQTAKHKAVYCMFYLLHISLVYPQQVKYAVKNLDEIIRHLNGDFTRIGFAYQRVQVAFQSSTQGPNSTSSAITPFPEILVLDAEGFASIEHHDIYEFASRVYATIVRYNPTTQETKTPEGAAYNSDSEESRPGHSRNQSRSIWLFTEEQLAEINQQLAPVNNGSGGCVIL